jgi:hypothetical protein
MSASPTIGLRPLRMIAGVLDARLTVHVTKTNDHAKADKGLTKTYTLSHADVSFGAGVNKTSPAVGSRVHLKGTITRLEKKCNQTGFTPTITITKVAIHRA